jgi:hypothetical protein
MVFIITEKSAQVSFLRILTSNIKKPMCRHIHVSLMVQGEEPLIWRDGKSSALSAIQFRIRPAVLLESPMLQKPVGVRILQAVSKV